MRLLAGLVALALALAGGLARADARPAWAAAGRSTTLSVPEADGSERDMVVWAFAPVNAGPGPWPVVVFSHGRDAAQAGRARVTVGVSHAQLVYWLSRGVAVVAPIRPGYGASGGGDIESSGVHVDRDGHCVGTADFARSADAAARAVEATLRWMKRQSWADTGQVLLVGQSVGGLTTVAAGARDLPGVVGYVNFAGGSGGNPERSPGASCEPGRLEALYAGYGRSTHVPNLWVYALNDAFWGEAAPRAWHAAFADGGSLTYFVQAPPVEGDDGHALSSHAPALWSPYVDRFLATLGPPWNAAAAPRPVLRLDAGGP